MRSDYSMMEPGLDALAAYGPDLRNGLTSHAPMVVEALAALGRPEAVMPWIERYRDGLLPRPTERDPILLGDWTTALGRPERAGDWNALFERELGGAPWREVLARWTARLAPGICASAAHGVIRVGHAARSLAERESPARVRELGDAFASWAAAYQTLPTGQTTRQATGARDAVAAIPIVPPAERRFTGTIVSSLEGLADFSAFAPVIGYLDVTPDPAGVVGELTESFARVYLANARDVLGTIVFVHAVTSLAAVRSILPVLDPATARTVVAYGWQASAALHSAFGSTPPPADAIAPVAEGAETLVDMAVAHGDEHAIKFTEACLREEALRPSPAYRAAAKHAIAMLPGSTTRRM